MLLLACLSLTSCAAPPSLAVDAAARDWRLGATTLSVQDDGTFSVANLPSDVLDGIDTAGLAEDVSGSGVWTVEAPTGDETSHVLHLQLADVMATPIDLWFDFGYDQWDGYEMTMVRDPGLAAFQMH